MLTDRFVSAFADTLRGLYQLYLACVDLISLGQYFNFAEWWQYEGACDGIGFLAVFASMLSIYTLCAMTFEHWYLPFSSLTFSYLSSTSSPSLLSLSICPPCSFSSLCPHTSSPSIQPFYVSSSSPLSLSISSLASFSFTYFYIPLSISRLVHLCSP